MTSQINPNFPVYGIPTTSTVRQNFAYAKAEIEALQLGSSNNITSVKGFGAVGDGVHDDGPAIVAAVNSLNGQPGTIYFPSGRYLWGGPGAIIQSNTRITGAGSNISVIVPSTAMTPGPGGFYPIFRSNNVVAIPNGAETDLPTIPANQTDHDIQIDHLGFDLSNMGPRYTIVFAFLLARDLVVDNIEVYKPMDTTGYSGFKFVGCDNISFTNVVARGAQNILDNYKGTTRLRAHNVMFESYQGGGNGGLITWNGIGQYIADFEHNIGFQLTNATIWLYSGCAMFLDCLGPGSSSQNMLFENIVISARTGTNCRGIICRGWINRLKCHNISFDAQPGADITPFIVGGLFTQTPTQDPAPNCVTTTTGSNQFTVSWSDGCQLGPGNYMHIGRADPAAPDSPTLNGNGLSLNGYYKVIAVSGPILDPGVGAGSETNIINMREGRVVHTTSNGNLFTCEVLGQTATASGPINVITGVQGFYGHPKTCEFQGITFDGVSALGADLIHIGCNVLRIDGVTVTDNYNGFTTPQYRSIVGATDSVRLDGEFKIRAEISGVVGRPGTKALLGGWKGDNRIAWDAYSYTPILSDPLVGTFTPTLLFNDASVGMVYKEQTGAYTRIGDIVHFSLAVSITTKGTSIGTARIGGFPFTMGVGQARGTYTANFGLSKVSLSPSGTTTAIVYSATVNSLVYTIAVPGSGGTTGTYPLTLIGGTGSGGSATFRVIGTDSVADAIIASPGSGGTDDVYRVPFVGGGGTASVSGLDDIWITVAGGKVTAALVHTNGKNYTSAPAVDLSSIPGLTGAVVTTVLGNGGVGNVQAASRGVYTVAPTATATAPGLVGASITVALNTTGTMRRTEIIGRMGVDGCSLAFDVDDSGIGLTSSEFQDGCFLRMLGWYFVSDSIDVDQSVDDALREFKEQQKFLTISQENS